MKFQSLLALSLLTLAGTITAAAATKAATKAVEIAAPAVATDLTEQVAKTSLSYLTRAKNFVTSLPAAVHAKYAAIRDSKCVAAQAEFAKAHKTALIVTAVVATAAVAYAIYQRSQTKKDKKN